jgi:hypothetical protein
LEKIAQNVAQLVFCQNYCATFRPKIGAAAVSFQKAAQNKQSPNRRKLVQSGHPGCRQLFCPIFYGLDLLLILLCSVCKLDRLLDLLGEAKVFRDRSNKIVCSKIVQIKLLFSMIIQIKLLF